MSLDEDLDALDRMVRNLDIPWPQIADGKVDQGQVPKLYNVRGTPTLILIDRAGRLFGRVSSDRELEKRIPDLLATVSAPAWSPRDAWQRPQALMDSLGINAGTRVADIGAGDGYFTFHLAARVGADGRVFAVDIDEQALRRLRERAERERLAQVTTVPSAPDDPKLEAGSVDVVLVVDAYHEFRDYDAMLRGIVAALRPGGRLGIVDTHGPLDRARSEYHKQHNIPAELVIEDAARHGLRLATFERVFATAPGGNRGSYLAVFEKPRPN